MRSSAESTCIDHRKEKEKEREAELERHNINITREEIEKMIKDGYLVLWCVTWLLGL